MSGVLYVVATPIGNLGDITYRAVEILRSVDCVLAEDTRQTKKLLDHYAISAKLKALHEHNERQATDSIVSLLSAGQNLALVSDAGTPLISDPGYHLISACRVAGLVVKTIPGPSALIAALSISGLPTDQFKFIGFLPSKQAARRAALELISTEPSTHILYESTHRIVACLKDIDAVMGPERQIVLAKELTKQFENVFSGSAADVLKSLEAEPTLQKGEFVLMISGGVEEIRDDASMSKILQPLMACLPLKQAAAVASEITGEKKNRLYQLALNLRDAH